MAKGISFNFGANARKKKTGTKKTKKAGKSKGNKSQAWRAYISNAPIPD